MQLLAKFKKTECTKLWEELTLESQRQQTETGSGVRKKLQKYWANFLQKWETAITRKHEFLSLQRQD